MQQAADQAIISQLYPNLYTPVAPQQPGNGQQPPKRRRRRKSKSSESDAALKKRKLTDEQVTSLEMSFECEHKLESDRKDRLASELGLDPRQVAVWFQNRRARWKNKKLEEEYSKLRHEHENLVVDKCRLETEILSLKDQLNEAKKDIQTLLERSSSSSADNVSANSPSSSMTMDHHANVIDPQLLGDQFGMGGCFDGMFYTTGSDYVPGIDWVDLYNL